MLVLGLNAATADAAACLLRDGRLVAAAEEERFRRIKHWSGFPQQALAYCLAEAGVALHEVDHIAFAHELPQPAALPGCRAQWHGVPSARAHLSSAFHVSPFDEALVLAADEACGLAWGLGRGSDIGIGAAVQAPLGAFYRALTRHLGFPQPGDEYKLMGLAPFGRPGLLAAMRQILTLLPDGGCEIAGAGQGNSMLAPDALQALFGPARGPGEALTRQHKDIAHAVQAMYEQALFHLLDALHARHPLPTLALGGSCALNSVANGRIRRHTPFERLYIQPASGGAGSALGAALTVWFDLQRGTAPPRFTMEHACWGPAFSDADIAALLQAAAARLQGCIIDHVPDTARLCRRIAADIAAGRVVGWFQGRMEWGPRALGNRSILCDPRRADIRELLNLKIKRRESFRPFAPAVLHEAASDWFEHEGEVPFMTEVVPVRPALRARIPAVTHVDGSGRLQTVTAQGNPRFHALITAFRDLTGVPMVLNTSFNENEPVVCQPREALDCFLRTQMDVLVMGDRVLRRGRSEAENADVLDSPPANPQNLAC